MVNIKTLLVTLFLPVALFAQTRDSLYTMDSTASATSVTLSLTAEQAASLYRCWGVNWRQEIQSTINARANQCNPLADPKVQDVLKRIDKVEKAKVEATAKTVQVVKRVPVKVVELPIGEVEGLKGPMFRHVVQWPDETPVAPHPILPEIRWYHTVGAILFVAIIIGGIVYGIVAVAS